MKTGIVNKKIKNATPLEYDGITFKSKVEVTIYKELQKAGITPKYEKVTYHLSNAMRPTVPFYNRSKSKGFHYEMAPLREITYTPDFVFDYNNILVIIEVKGIENDVFPVKRNLFRKLLEEQDKHILFFEIRTKTELKQALEIIKTESPMLKRMRELIPYLPDKDISIANNYMSKRDFNSLLDLVTSAMKKLRRNKTEEQTLKMTKLDKLHRLEQVIEDYIFILES